MNNDQEEHGAAIFLARPTQEGMVVRGYPGVNVMEKIAESSAVTINTSYLMISCGEKG